MLTIRNIKYYGNTSTEYGECKDMIGDHPKFCVNLHCGVE